ncbi:MAG: carboxypeptidase-like regulatory domain-containing protein [Bryobacteraceae bacterium]
MRILFWLLATGSWLLASIDGTVVNATTGKPQAAVIVILVQPTAQGPQTVATVKSDAQGQFKIDKEIPPGPELLQAIYQGVLYTLVLPPGSPTTGVHLKVYDATAKAGVAKVSQHMILIEPNTTTLEVSETFLLENETTTTFQDPVNGSIQFYLPEAAGGKVSVTINSPGSVPIQRPAEKTKEKDIYKIAYPVRPGESRFDVSYSLPATETFASKILHGEGVTRLVTPSTVTLSGDGVESLGQEPQTKAHIYNAGGAEYSVEIAGVGSLRNPEAAAPDEDTGEPQIEEKAARVYSRMYWVMGMAFAILGLGGVLLYRKSAA